MYVRPTFLLLFLAACGRTPATGAVNAGTAWCTETTCEAALAIRLDDLRGKPVTSGLDADQFTLADIELEGDGSYEVASTTVSGLDAETTDGGLLVPVVIDQSGSMEGNDPDELRLSAAASTASALLGEDAARVALFAFPRQQDLGEFEDVDLVQDYTTDPEAVDAGITTLSGEEGGGTPLYDALTEVLTHQEATREGDEQAALIVLTDGSDGESSAGVEDVVAQATAAGVRIFAAGLGDSVDFDELGELTAGTGGVFVPATDAESLDQTLTGLAGAVYGNVTLTIAITLADDADPLEPGWYRLTGSVIWDGQLEMPLDVTFYLASVEDAS